MSCPYSELFGKPGEGFHKDRLFGLAANDLIGTVILIVIIAIVSGYSLLSVALVVSVLTVLIHKAFCVDTALNKKIFSK